MKHLNDFLLNLFTDNNEHRPWMNFPNARDGHVAATDSHVLIVMPENEVSLKYQDNDKFPSVERPFEQLKGKDTERMTVKLADLAKELTKARIVVDTLTIDCEECKGDATVFYEYRDKKGHYHEEECDCPECDGDGCVDKKHPFARISLDLIEGEDRLGINVGELYFHPFQLYRLFMAMVIKRLDEIEVRYDSDLTFLMADIEDISILIMAMQR